MACLGNLVIGLLGRAGPVNLAAELRRHARDPRRPSPPSGSASDEPGITIERRSPGEPRFWFCESPAGAPRVGTSFASLRRCVRRQRM